VIGAWSPVRRRLAAAELLAGGLYLPHATRVVTAPFDAWTHLLLASHYLLGWWTTTDARWYLGFDTTTYPPLAHQLLAAAAWPFAQLVPRLVALEVAYILLALLLVLAYPLGVYAFASTLVAREHAALAAVAGALFSGWWMLLYGYGQFPTLLALLFVLFGARALDTYLANGRRRAGLLAVLLTALVAMTHHFSTLSVLPAAYGVIVAKHLRADQPGWRRTGRRCVAVAGPAVALALAALFPFVAFSLGAADRPVIPHGSRTPWTLGAVVRRAQFWHTLLAGGLWLTLTPAVAWLVRDRRLLVGSLAAPTAFGLLALGYTTPLPGLLYGPLAPQLTYYRFAAWGGVLLLPALGVALARLRARPRAALVALVAVVLVLNGVAATQMTEDRYVGKSTDRRAEVAAVADVLTTGDNHRWRYLLVGMSQELGAVAIAAPQSRTIDGSYHRAREPAKLPHLVTTGTAQLANSKFERWGRDGRHASSLPVLEHYLANRDRFHLKYVFSADPYYAATLRAHGYEVLYEWPGLEVRAWYDPDVPPVPAGETSPTVADPAWYAYPWGTVPLATLGAALVVAARGRVRRGVRWRWPDVA
jgi:hypothetical protein